MAGSDVSYGKRLTDPPVKVKLYEHQRRGWLRAMDALVFGGGGFGLLYEMGCGKTLTAIAVTGAGYKLGKIKRVLIVAPTSVCAVWPKEFSDYAAFPYTIKTFHFSQIIPFKSRIVSRVSISGSINIFSQKPCNFLGILRKIRLKKNH